MITVTDAKGVLLATRIALGLANASDGATLDDMYIAATIWRVAGFTCPCSPKTISRSVIESNRHLGPSDEVPAERLETVIEAMMAYGDLLELSHISTVEEGVKGTWIFAAPPSFVARPSGAVFILGLAADEATPLPVDMRKRIRYRGVTRSVEPLEGEDLVKTLRDLGLRELSVDAWQRHPKVEPASALVASLDRKVSAQEPCGDVLDLRILDGSLATKRYRDRWTEPKAQTGHFVVRRPQAYGADLWGYAEADRGRVVRMIDFPPPGVKWRGCDIAWRLQMAIDALADRPQGYRIVRQEGWNRFDFFSPIPDWARRRLSIVGEQTEAQASLLSFLVPEKEVTAEERFLHDFLFLVRLQA